MSEIEMNISLPLDDDRFLRRECPLCLREFKVQLEQKELVDLAQEGIDSFLIEASEEKMVDGESEPLETKLICPYCGQQASSDSWWTQEQLAYIGVFARNILAKLVNEYLVRPLKRASRRSSSGLISISFEAEEMQQQEPWISPEVNDMEVFDLPCCERQIKIEEDWAGVVYCHFCGFPHNNRGTNGR